MLTHMRPLSSEVKDWKSRVVTETEQVLCRESAQTAEQATKIQEAMDKRLQAQWKQTEAKLQDLCKSNSTHAQTLAIKLQETQLQHQQLYTAPERQLQLEAQALKQSQEQEQQAYSLAQEHECAIQEFRRQAEEQPEVLKSPWQTQLSQQASYKAEIHELYTEMLNMQERSEMKAALSANMRRLEQPSLTVEAEPESVLNTASPGRRSSSIRDNDSNETTGGVRTPEGAPVPYGPSPVTQQYSHQVDLSVPPAQWGDRDFRTHDDEEDVDLFQDALQPGADQVAQLVEQELFQEQQDELNAASAPRPVQPLEHRI